MLQIFKRSLLLGFSVVYLAQGQHAGAQDIEVTEILVVDERNTAVNGKVFREPHQGNRELIGPAIDGRVDKLNEKDVTCDAGELFTADPDQSGYTQIYLGTERCRENIVIVLAAPQTALSLAFLADDNLATGDPGLAAVQFSEAQARVSFDIKLEDGSSFKTYLALKSYESLEKALGKDGLFAVTESGWPVLNQAGSKAIMDAQKNKGLKETGKFDLNAYMALTDQRMNTLIMQAYREPASVRLQDYIGRIGVIEDKIARRERIG